LAPLARFLGGPAGERGTGGIDRRLGVLHRGAGNRGDRVLGRRIDDVEAPAVRRLAPLSTDPEIGRYIGEETFVHADLHSLVVVARMGRSEIRGSYYVARLIPHCASLHAGYELSDRLTRSTMRSTVGSATSSRISAAGSGMCGVVIRTGGPSRS